METLDAEKRELEATLDKEQMHTVQLKQELAVAEMKNSELTKASFISMFLLNHNKVLFVFKILTHPF